MVEPEQQRKQKELPTVRARVVDERTAKGGQPWISYTSAYTSLNIGYVARDKSGLLLSDACLVRHIVHDDRRRGSPVVHRRQAAVSLLPRRVPNLELHGGVIELHLLRQKCGCDGPQKQLHGRQEDGVNVATAQRERRESAVNALQRWFIPGRDMSLAIRAKVESSLLYPSSPAPNNGDTRGKGVERDLARQGKTCAPATEDRWWAWRYKGVGRVLSVLSGKPSSPSNAADEATIIVDTCGYQEQQNCPASVTATPLPETEHTRMHG